MVEMKPGRSLVFCFANDLVSRVDAVRATGLYHIGSMLIVCFASDLVRGEGGMWRGGEAGLAGALGGKEGI